MNQEIYDYLAKYNESKGWKTSEEDILETILESKIVYSEEDGGHRWWNDEFRVIKVNDFYVGYSWATATGDTSVRDLGWEFDWDSLVWARPQEITKTIYVPIKN